MCFYEGAYSVADGPIFGVLIAGHAILGLAGKQAPTVSEVVSIH